MIERSLIQDPFPSGHGRRRLRAIALCLAALSIVTIVAACGGGGGTGSGDTNTPPVVEQPDPPVVEQPDPPDVPLPELPLQRAQDSGNSPIRYVGRELRIGADVAPRPDTLDHALTHRGVSVSHGTLDDGVGADHLIAYLTDDTRENAFHRDPNGSIYRFDDPPTVHVPADATPAVIDLTVQALQVINAALPRDWQLRLAASPTSFHFTPGTEPPSAQIVIRFAAYHDWPPPPEAPRHPDYPNQYPQGYAQLFLRSSAPTDPAGLPFLSINAAGVLVDHTLERRRAPHFQHSYILDVLIHEIIHALGRQHPSIGSVFETVMARHPDFADLIYPLDREALLAAYSRLRPGSTVASLAEDLGAWSDTSTHLLGEFSAGGEDVSFGVALRNGLAQPWATGPAPLTNLADNAALSGSASWSGALLGFTPEAQPVAGAADLTITLDTLDGDLDFSELEYWSAGQAPGAAGSGTAWSDGDLSYDIDVRGNTFSRNGGDDGIVTGAFLGTRHQAMGGTLQRDDLSAAFGGSR